MGALVPPRPWTRARVTSIGCSTEMDLWPGTWHARHGATAVAPLLPSTQKLDHNLSRAGRRGPASVRGPSSSRRQHSNTCHRAQTSRLQRIPRLLRKCLPNGLTTAAVRCPLQCKWPSLRKWRAEFVTQHQRLFLGTVALLWGAEC